MKYRQAIGKLLYIAFGSRPDIAYGVGVLGRFVAKPGEETELSNSEGMQSTTTRNQSGRKDSGRRLDVSYIRRSEAGRILHTMQLKC